jgi:hypothetical protein
MEDLYLEVRGKTVSIDASVDRDDEVAMGIDSNSGDFDTSLYINRNNAQAIINRLGALFDLEVRPEGCEVA